MRHGSKVVGAILAGFLFAAGCGPTELELKLAELDKALKEENAKLKAQVDYLSMKLAAEKAARELQAHRQQRAEEQPPSLPARPSPDGSSVSSSTPSVGGGAGVTAEPCDADCRKHRRSIGDALAQGIELRLDLTNGTCFDYDAFEKELRETGGFRGAMPLNEVCLVQSTPSAQAEKVLRKGLEEKGIKTTGASKVRLRCVRGVEDFAPESTPRLTYKCDIELASESGARLVERHFAIAEPIRGRLQRASKSTADIVDTQAGTMTFSFVPSQERKHKLIEHKYYRLPKHSEEAVLGTLLREVLGALGGG